MPVVSGPNNVNDYHEALNLRDKDLTQDEIAEKLGYNQSTISRWFNSKRRPKGYTKFELNSKHLGIIEGELLGDGSIVGGGKNRHFRFEIESTVESHVNHILEKLPRNCFTSNSKKLRKYSNRVNTNKTYAVYTRTSPTFTKLRRKWYPKGDKKIPHNFDLTPTKAHYWYIGDGCLSYDKYHKELKITTYTFARKLMERMLNQIRNKTEIEGGGIKELSNSFIGHGYKLTFYRKKDIKNFLEWIGKPIIREYKYKWVEECQ